MEGDPVALQWSAANFGHASLGDARLTQRAMQLAARIRANPQASLPRQCQSPAELAGAYRLLSNARVDPQALQMNHRRLTAERCRAQAVVLVVQDTTQLDFSRRAARGSITGVGPLGSKHKQGKVPGAGLLQHAALAVDVDGRTRGVLDQRWHCQKRATPGETRSQRRARGTEADHWAATARAVAQLDLGDTRLIHVGDRHSDVFDFLQTVGELGHGYVVRAMHNRHIDDGTLRLADKLASLPVVDTQALEVSARSGPPKSKRAARRATLGLKFDALPLQPPRNDPRFTDASPLDAFVIELTEIDPPDDVEPIAWTLLTSEPVRTIDDAWRVVDHYRKRWTIEQWHRALKEGCRLEDCRLDHADDVMRLAAITGPVAADLLQLRDLADDATRADDSSLLRMLLPAAMLVAASKLLRVKVDQLTPTMFWRLLARKGGHLGRKRDPRPGWQAIWTGWQQVAMIAQGIQLAWEGDV